jgi:predicted nuclease of predicted toxin-antitoxin system
MRFLVDECTGPGVAKWLAEQGHDVFSAFDQAKGAADVDLLDRAVAEDRILLTNDRDFGEMIYRDNRAHRGVIFLRLHDERTPTKIRVLAKMLGNYAERLPGKFAVVTEAQLRLTNEPPLAL